MGERMKVSTVTKAMVLATMMATAPSVSAKEFKVLPILDGNFCGNVKVGAAAGYINFSNIPAAGITEGVEITFDCPVFTLPWDNLRQQIMLNRFNGDGLNMTSLEFNPYYIITLDNGVEWGFGPGWGVHWTDTYKSDVAFSFQVGTGLQYNISKELYTGADVRYQWTQQIDVTPGVSETLDNYRAQVKIGYRF